MRLILIHCYLFIFLVISQSVYSQIPNNLSFQAVIRNASNQLVVSSPVGIRVSLLQGGINGTAVYSETHNVTTNTNGLVTLEIGGGAPASGIYNAIDWSKGNYFIKIEADPAGGSNYSIVTSSQILSVPYALYAKKSADVDSLAAKLKAIDSLVSANAFIGENTIFITGDIDEIGVADKIKNEFGNATQQIIVSRCTQLKKLDLSFINRWVRFDISDNPVLSEINLSNIPILQSGANIYQNPQLNIVDLSKVQEVRCIPNIQNPESIQINGPTLSQLFLNNLKKIYFASLYIGGPNFKNYTNNNLSEIYFSFLQVEGSQNISFNNLIMATTLYIGGTSTDTINLKRLKKADNLYLYDRMQKINLDSLVETGFFVINDNSGLLKTIEFPSLQKISNFSIAAKSLQSVSIASLNSIMSTAVDNASFGINGLLSSIEINSILAKLVAILPQASSLQSSVRISLKQNFPAPPTGQGLIDKQILISRGHTVITD